MYRQLFNQIFSLNFRYCDVFQKCREVDPSGPLATLRKLLLSEESIASFKNWMYTNWFIISFIIFAAFGFLVNENILFNSTNFV